MTDSKTNLIIDSKKDSKTMLKITCAALEDKKAFDIKIIDISKISTLCDYIVIADGTNKKTGSGALRQRGGRDERSGIQS